MWRFAIFLVPAALGAVAVAELMRRDPGYVLIAYGGYTVESSLWVGLLLLCMAFVVIWVVLALVVRLLKLPGRLRRQSK